MLISLYGVPGCLLPCNMEWIISSGAQIPSKLVHVFPFTEFFSQLTLNLGLYPGTECTAEASKAGMSCDYRQGLQLNVSATGKILARASWHLPMLLRPAAEHPSPLVSRGSSWSSAPQQLTYTPESSTAVPADTCLWACFVPYNTSEDPKALQKGGGDSNKVMQKPSASSTIICVVATELRITKPQP